MDIFPAKFEPKHYFLLVVFLLVIGSLLAFEASDRVFHVIDSFALVATILALLITLAQISRVKKSSEAAEAATTAATKDLSFFLRATEIARVQRYIEEIKQYNRAGKIDLSLIRLGDLRNDLIFLQNNPVIAAFINTKDIKNHILEIDILNSSFEKDVQSGSTSTDIVTANVKLHGITKTLTILDSRIKQQ